MLSVLDWFEMVGMESALVRTDGEIGFGVR